MNIVPRRLIGWLSGTPTTTSIPVVVLSDTDAPITISVYSNGNLAAGNLVGTFVVTASTGGGTNPGSGATNGLLTKYADDRTQNKILYPESPTDVPDPKSGLTYVCWIGRHTLTGLSPGTRYYIKLTQGSTVEGAVYGDGISTCTAPAAGTDYRLWCLSCDRTRIDEDNTAKLQGTRFGNAYGYIKRWQDSNPADLSYLWFVDDWGYADASPIVDTDKESSFGLSGSTPSAPQSTGNGYDYGLFYSRSMLGMGSDTSQQAIYGGREFCRSWVHRNHNMVLTQWGDHEFIDQFKYTSNDEDRPHIWAAAEMAWGEIFDHLNNGAFLGVLDTESRHIGTLFGDAYLCSPDGKTQMGATSHLTSVPTDGYNDPVDPWYGNNQIDDILDALDNDAPFKIIGKADGDKAYCDSYSTVATGTRINHQEMKQHAADEWSRLFTRNSGSPASLMANDKTNGTDGVLITWNGDVHLQLWAHHGAAADGSNHAEDFSAWFTGTASNHPQVTPTRGVFADYAVNGGVFDGTRVMYISNSGAPEGTDPEPLVSCLAIDILGASTPKQAVCQLYNDGKVKAKAIYEVGSNKPVSPEPWLMKGFAGGDFGS